jgi:pyrroloquinoline-quinone synthase
MDVHPRLLDHPFYQAWTRGEVSLDTLGAYHRTYGQLIRRIPIYWQTVVEGLSPQAPSVVSVVEEEKAHVFLWEEWGKHLPQESATPSDFGQTINALDRMTPSQLLGALQAFEMQQPEVAHAKKEGLMVHYGVPASSLRYFEEHLAEEKHITYGGLLAELYAEGAEFEQGFHGGADLLYHALDQFVPEGMCS